MTPPRDDLLHLTPEALSHASNAGLVKRAVRELAAGYRPHLTLDAQGGLVATFDDGVRCQWPPGITLKDVVCNCGATGVCRHRLITALHYRAQATTFTPAPDATPVAQASDEALARVVPATLLATARALRNPGMVVELRRRSSGEPCDTARLPTATVRYWAGAALEAARCDCQRAAACEHVALGLWAFRAADEQDTTTTVLSVRLGGAGQREVIDPAPYQQLINSLLRHGVSQGTAPLTQALSTARAAAADAAWLTSLLVELETWCEGYAQRSALYDPADGVELLAELALRVAAGRQPGQAAAVLGTGKGGDTALDRVRLMCLGARTRRDGETRRTQLVMVDVDTGTRLVLHHPWQVPDDRQAEEASLRASQRLAPGLSLDMLAKGQLLAQNATRLPDGSVRLARARTAQNSVLPHTADWGSVGMPVRHTRVATLREAQQAHPIAALLPRHAARRFIVFTPATVEGLVFDPHTQCVQSVLRDEEGEPMLLQRTHEHHLPQALDTVAASLSGANGPLRHVAGVLSWDHGVPCLEPWAIVCNQMVVPDFATQTTSAFSPVPRGQVHPRPDDPIARLLSDLRQQLAQLLHHGLARLPGHWAGEAMQLARDLDHAGLRALAGRWQTLVPEVVAAQANPVGADLASPVMALAALRQLHSDATHLGPR